MKFSCHFIKF